MKKSFFLILFYFILFYSSSPLFAQNDHSNQEDFNLFIQEKNIEKLPRLVLDLFQNPDQRLLQESLRHVEKLEKTRTLSSCEQLCLVVTEIRILQHMNKFDKAINLFKAFENELLETTCSEIKPYEIYSDLGAVYNYVGKNTAALAAYYKALNFSRKSHDTITMCSVNINIGNIYFVLKKYDRTKKCYEESIRLAGTQSKYKIQRAHGHSALGNLYLNTNNLPLAKENFTIAIAIFREQKRKIYEIEALNNLGIVYETEGNNFQALKLYLQVFDYATKAKEFRILANVSLDMAYNYLSMGQQSKAIAYFEQSYINYQKIGLIDGMKDVSFELSKLYRDNKDFEKAYNHQVLFERYKDSLNASSNAEQLMALKKDYEFGLEREHLNNEVLNYKLKYTILLISLLCLALLGGLFFLIRKRKAQLRAVHIQEQFTFQLLQNTEEERSRIANELHDSVNHDLLALKNDIINGQQIGVGDISKVIEEVRNISRNLHPAILETLGLAASIENLCDRLTEVGLFTTCELDYQIELPKNKELQLYRIVQEALNNTLKHGNADAAKVTLTSQENYLLLEIKDNGIGFNVDSQLNNPNSFGLQSILQRAKALLSKIHFDSSTSGTIIQLKIPV